MVVPEGGKVSVTDKDCAVVVERKSLVGPDSDRCRERREYGFCFPPEQSRDVHASPYLVRTIPSLCVCA